MVKRLGTPAYGVSQLAIYDVTFASCCNTGPVLSKTMINCIPVNSKSKSIIVLSRGAFSTTVLLWWRKWVVPKTNTDVSIKSDELRTQSVSRRIGLESMETFFYF